VARPIALTEDEAELSMEQRASFARTVWSLITANADDRPRGRDVGRARRPPPDPRPLRVDEQGWTELAAAYMELYERVYEIQTDAAERLGQDPEDSGISVLSVLAFFETPEAAPAVKLAVTTEEQRTAP